MPHRNHFKVLRWAVALPFIVATAAAAANAATTNAPTAIPWNQIGAKAGADYQGEGLAVTPTESGARLHCVFQRLDGEATPEGLWLTSTVTNMVSDPSSVAALRRVDRFRVTAVEVGRNASMERGALESREACGVRGIPALSKAVENTALQTLRALRVPEVGKVAVEGQTVRLSRRGLTEEYSVSMDGVRQDFVVTEEPAGEGPLKVELAVSGAQVEPAADGARLVLAHSGRKIAYSRLRVTDATGKELSARMEVVARGEALGDVESQRDSITQPRVASRRATLGTNEKYPRNPEGVALERDLRCDQRCDATPLGLAVNSRSTPRVARRTRNPGLSDTTPSGWNEIGAELMAMPRSDTRDGAHGVTRPTMLVVLVDDSNAVYPVRIDPTFSDANWVSMGGLPGVNGQVTAAVIDGSGNLYIGGDFTTAGNTFANSIAQWNGSSWSALGSGMGGTPTPNVYALAVSGGTLYAGGTFTTAGGTAANYIAQWNGTSWSALGSGMNSWVSALAVSGSTLYAGGLFTTAGGSAANYIAQWNGTSWSALGSGVSGGGQYGFPVAALAVSGSTLYAGGVFTTAGDIAANNIAQWNGSSWSALGSGIGGVAYDTYVLALAVSGSTLYVGGTFTTAGGTAANNIARWNGSSWSALGSGMDGNGPSVGALVVSGSTLYAGGSFTTAGGSAANYIAQWNGSSWSALGSGMNTPVVALAVSGSTLYAGGYFTTASGSAANSIAQWKGSRWSALGSGALGSGMNSYVEALAVSGSTLYAGGLFTTAGGSPANYIAQWNGSSWSPLGSGMNSNVYALAISGGTLYAGGTFTTAGGSAANNIAQWNGSSWSPLGSGTGGGIYPYVVALAVSGSTLYAGGYFTTAGGSAANYIAQWNGSSWSALGSGMNDVVVALAVSGSTLYAGGFFTTAGGSAANRIAQWNGSSWSALGSGMSGGDHNGPYVQALAVSGSTLYAGGDFTTAGGSAANYIAQWNGSSWSALGSGISGGDYNGNGPYVLALAVSGGTLYAGGIFTTAGGSAANYIAQWNGSSWSALGSGVGGSSPYVPSVFALAVSGGTLYAGGTFTTAGGKVSAYFAEAYLVAPPGGLVGSIVVPSSGTADLRCYGNPGQQFGMQRTINLSPPLWINLNSSPLIPAADGLFTFVDTNAPPGAAFYRAFQY